MEAMDIFLATTRDVSYVLVNHPVYSVIGGIVAMICLLRFYCRLTLGICSCDQDMTGKTVLITGASAGIGKATAFDLARRNARVLLACRNLGKAEKVAREIRSATGNENIVVKHLDLCSFESVRRCAEDVLKTEEKLHVLINNAGVARGKGKVTEDGCEIIMQANHLGHFLLTLLLLDLLKKSAPSRIINVSSAAYTLAQLDVDDMNNAKASPMSCYFNSKLANILFTSELASRLTGSGVTVNAIHPGLVKTDILQSSDNILTFLSKISMLLWGKTAEEGAQTTIYVAVHPDLENTTGKYFSDCKEEQLSSKATDKAMAKRLFENSEKLVGITFKKS